MAQSYPGIIEAKDIAEAGFIYGLPLVMNYAVMNEFAVDPKSSAVQGAVQSGRRTSTTSRLTKTRPLSRRTAIRRTPYCGWICVPSRW